MTHQELYRADALKARQVTPIGSIILISPVSFSVLTVLSVAFVVMVIAFLILGHYTSKSAVSGQLVPSSGLVKVYARQPGIILSKKVVEGQEIKRGDELFILSEEQRNAHGDTQAAITGQIETRRTSLREELTKTRSLQRRERQQHEQTIISMQMQLTQLSAQVATQEEQVQLAREGLRRYQELVQKNYVSKDTLLQKEAALLDQQQRLNTGARERLVLNSELGQRRTELASLAFKHQNQLAQIERQLASEEQEFTSSESKRKLIVTAPESGVAASPNADVGQMVNPDRPLVSIVPANSRLQAQLLVPTSAIGFVQVGSPVLIRYRAYTFQKFGHARATVVSVSASALSAREIDAQSVDSQRDGGEPLFRVTVDLPKQSISAYGQNYPLRAGMMVDADILVEKRRLYEWVLEPLHSLTRNL